MDARVPYSVHRIRNAVYNYKRARKHIFKHLGAIIKQIDGMDQAMLSIHKDLLSLNKPMFDHLGNILPREDKVNVYSKILSIVRSNPLRLFSKRSRIKRQN